MKPLRVFWLLVALMLTVAALAQGIKSCEIHFPGFSVAQAAVTTPAAAPSGREPGAVFRDCPDCPEMVVVRAGNFIMGSAAAEKSWAASHGGSMKAVADEAPQHHVSLPSFALGRYDITRGEYAAFARETGYPADDGCGRGRAIFKWEKDPKLTWENPAGCWSIHCKRDQGLLPFRPSAAT